MTRKTTKPESGSVVYSRAATVSDDTKSLFLQLADQWKSQTAHVSFIGQRIQHPAYQKILGMGKGVIPFIFEEMEREPDHWFHALAILTGENPLPSDFRGTIKDAVSLWVQWGRESHA